MHLGNIPCKYSKSIIFGLNGWCTFWIQKLHCAMYEKKTIEWLLRNDWRLRRPKALWLSWVEELEAKAKKEVHFPQWWRLLSPNVKWTKLADLTLLKSLNSDFIHGNYEDSTTSTTLEYQIDVLLFRPAYRHANCSRQLPSELVNWHQLITALDLDEISKHPS